MRIEHEEVVSDIDEDITHLEIRVIPEGEEDLEKLKEIEDDDFHCEIFRGKDESMRIIF